MTLAQLERAPSIERAVARAPIRIVRVIARLNIGGPARQAMLLSESFGRDGWDTLLITGTPAASEGDMSHLMDASVRIRRVSSLRRSINPVRDAAAWWQIFQAIRRERPQIVHTHTAKAGALGRSAAIVYNHLERWRAGITRRPPASCRIVHTLHGHVLEGYFGRAASTVFLVIERFLARHTDRIITVSQAVRDDLLRRGIGTPDRLQVIPLGLWLEPLLELPPPLEQPAELRVGIVARLVPIKHHELFLRLAAACAAQRELSHVRFEVIGDGELRNWLQRMARALGGRVSFHGWETNLPEVYRRLDVVCLTSLNEGTPVSVIESLAAARPVLATDVGGVRDLLVPLEPDGGVFRRSAHGALAPSGDVQGLQAGLRYLVAHPQQRRVMGMAGRAFVRERHGVDRLTQDLATLYRGLCRGPAAH